MTNLRKLDESELATVLAALRLFQREYRDCDASTIQRDWPDHFELTGDEDGPTVIPEPLGSEDIDALCEQLNFLATDKCPYCGCSKDVTKFSLQLPDGSWKWFRCNSTYHELVISRTEPAHPIEAL